MVGKNTLCCRFQVTGEDEVGEDEVLEDVYKDCHSWHYILKIKIGLLTPPSVNVIHYHTAGNSPHSWQSR
jgi:hypothetical protein